MCKYRENGNDTINTHNTIEYNHHSGSSMLSIGNMPERNEPTEYVRKLPPRWIPHVALSANSRTGNINHRDVSAKRSASVCFVAFLIPKIVDLKRLITANATEMRIISSSASIIGA